MIEPSVVPKPEVSIAVFEDLRNRSYMRGLDGLEKLTIVLDYTSVRTDPEVALPNPRSKQRM